MTVRFNFMGVMTLALVLGGGCASREELAARRSASQTFLTFSPPQSRDKVNFLKSAVSNC